MLAAGEVKWRRAVPHAEAVLHLEAPIFRSATALRGAVVAALHGDVDRAHVDWHNHIPEIGENRNASPYVMYRVHGGVPSVWLWGPRAHENAARLARELAVLRGPAGGQTAVDAVDLATHETAVGLHKSDWFRYRITDYWPTSVALSRRPNNSIFRPAWAGQAIAGSIRMWLAELGLETQPHRPVHVQVESGRTCRLRWRGDRDRAWGLSCEFVTNAILPDGFGLGQHRSEGFGEVRLCR